MHLIIPLNQFSLETHSAGITAELLDCVSISFALQNNCIFPCFVAKTAQAHSDLDAEYQEINFQVLL